MKANANYGRLFNGSAYIVHGELGRAKVHEDKMSVKQVWRVSETMRNLNKVIDEIKTKDWDTTSMESLYRLNSLIREAHRFWDYINLMNRECVKCDRLLIQSELNHMLTWVFEESCYNHRDEYMAYSNSINDNKTSTDSNGDVDKVHANDMDIQKSYNIKSIGGIKMNEIATNKMVKVDVEDSVIMYNRIERLRKYLDERKHMVYTYYPCDGRLCIMLSKFRDSKIPSPKRVFKTLQFNVSETPYINKLEKFVAKLTDNEKNFRYCYTHVNDAYVHIFIENDNHQIISDIITYSIELYGLQDRTSVDDPMIVELTRVDVNKVENSHPELVILFDKRQTAHIVDQQTFVVDRAACDDDETQHTDIKSSPKNITKPMRPAKDRYYLNIAKEVSTRSTCLRRKFGAIIVKDDRIVSSGYVGAPRGRINCSERGTCFRMENNIPSGTRYEACRSVHAEMNAIISASKEEMEGATMYLCGVENDGTYTNADCCSMCKRMIINSGISKVVIGTSLGMKTINVEEWVMNDDSLNMHDSY